MFIVERILSMFNRAESDRQLGFILATVILENFTVDIRHTIGKRISSCAEQIIYPRCIVFQGSGYLKRANTERLHEIFNQVSVSEVNFVAD